MNEVPYIAEVASLIGDPARAGILSALKGGLALTATELSHAAGVSPQTTSSHLAKLAQAHLVAVERQGRHRYYRLANWRVSEALDTLVELAVKGPPRHQPRGPRDDAVRHARSCYDHLAGRLGVALACSLSGLGYIKSSDDEYALTGTGERALSEFGIDIGLLRRGRRPLTRRCLDWSERQPHLGGAIGAAILSRTLDLGWVRRSPGTRAMTLTEVGRRGLRKAFAVDFEGVRN